jgi:tripeptidyl-peptidase-1
VVQTIQEEFDYNGESNLDLQYAMNLVNLVGSKQDVILYQVGDIPQGLRHFSII